MLKHYFSHLYQGTHARFIHSSNEFVKARLVGSDRNKPIEYTGSFFKHVGVEIESYLGRILKTNALEYQPRNLVLLETLSFGFIDQGFKQ